MPTMNGWSEVADQVLPLKTKVPYVKQWPEWVRRANPAQNKKREAWRLPFSDCVSATSLSAR